MLQFHWIAEYHVKGDGFRTARASSELRYAFQSCRVGGWRTVRTILRTNPCELIGYSYFCHRLTVDWIAVMLPRSLTSSTVSSCIGVYSTELWSYWVLDIPRKGIFCPGHDILSLQNQLLSFGNGIPSETLHFQNCRGHSIVWAACPRHTPLPHQTSLHKLATGCWK